MPLLVERFGIVPYARWRGVPRLAAPAPPHMYRRLAWGSPLPTTSQPLGDFIENRELSLQREADLDHGPFLEAQLRQCISVIQGNASNEHAQLSRSAVSTIAGMQISRHVRLTPAPASSSLSQPSSPRRLRPWRRGMSHASL